MNKFTLIGTAVVLLLLLLVGSCSFTHVTPGNVGIQVNNLGNGVQPESKSVGWYFTPPGVSIHEYPVSTRTYTWTQTATEQSPTNEEFSFQDKNGLTVTADLAVSYHVDAQKAPILYSKYRMDMDALVSGPLRTAIRSELAEQASNMGVEEIYGARKTELINKALAAVQKKFSPQGMDIEALYWASGIRVPDAVMKQINQKIANEQAALAAQANVAKATADAQSKVAEAEGDAKAMQVKGDAIRTNPEILTQAAIEKWDGHYPQYVGGGMPLPTLGLK